MMITKKVEQYNGWNRGWCTYQEDILHYHHELTKGDMQRIMENPELEAALLLL